MTRRSQYVTAARLIEELPALVRAARQQRGLSLRAAGEESGVYFTTISRVEQGTHGIDATTIKALLEWLANAAVREELCNECDKPFTEKEWGARHTAPDDPMAEVHEACCTECNR